MWWVEYILNTIVVAVVIVAGWDSSSGSISGSSSEGLFIGAFCCLAGEGEIRGWVRRVCSGERGGSRWSLGARCSILVAGAAT